MSTDSGKAAFLFPGQGAQAVGMGATVCSQVPAADEDDRYAFLSDLPCSR